MLPARERPAISAENGWTGRPFTLPAGMSAVASQVVIRVRHVTSSHLIMLSPGIAGLKIFSSCRDQWVMATKAARPYPHSSPSRPAQSSSAAWLAWVNRRWPDGADFDLVTWPSIVDAYWFPGP